MLPIAAIEGGGRHLLVLLQHQYLAWPVLLQAVVAAVLVLLSRIAAKRLPRALSPSLGRLPAGVVRRSGEALAGAAAWFLLLLAIWFVERIFVATGVAPRLLHLVESLALAWIIIRLSSGLVRNPGMARLFAVGAWIVAALNIAGLIVPAASLLGSMSITVGTLQLSALLLLKGVALLVVLIWAANLVSQLIESRLQSAQDITPAMRVLAAKLVRATLLTLAVVAALSAVGIDLTAFAVFSGAIGVGLGFGLQKVVSNLISGVILLLDRSIKPGDVIEIEGTYGWITKLNARFVSVVTRDGTEYLIPNEDLITQRVINWSYSNDLVRLHVAVGVAYGADLHEAMRLGVEMTKQVPRVLEAPAPICLLSGFGDSAVTLELRFWISDPREGTANVRSAVMLKVWDAYHVAGIEFPFPQRDLTLRNPEALAAAIATALHRSAPHPGSAAE